MFQQSDGCRDDVFRVSCFSSIKTCIHRNVVIIRSLYLDISGININLVLSCLHWPGNHARATDKPTDKSFGYSRASTPVLPQPTPASAPTTLNILDKNGLSSNSNSCNQEIRTICEFQLNSPHGLCSVRYLGKRAIPRKLDAILHSYQMPDLISPQISPRRRCWPIALSLRYKIPNYLPKFGMARQSV